MKATHMKRYDVTIPIAGHAIVSVEAESEEDAIAKALDSDQLTITSIESWEALERFHQGNFCCCPSPWEAGATLAFGEDKDVEESSE